MSTAVTRLIDRLGKGETLEDLLRSLLPQAEQELLKRCATVRNFDEALVDQVFRPGLSGASKDALPFKTLIDHPFVEPAGGIEGLYQFRESSRNDYFQLWQTADEMIPPDLKELSERLARYYEALGPQSELDVLHQLIISDPERAKQEFIRLYDLADRQFDLGRCQDLLKILESRNTLLNRSLRELFKERKYYLKARGLWSREYYQTVYYYEIEALERQMARLLADDAKWILQLHARGGMGKTIFLRWLIARRCVPEPARIPCTKIDFDFIDPVIASENPWMLLLEVAEQLNQQLPGNRFSDALGDLNEFKPILTKSDSSIQDNSQLRAAAQRRVGLQDIPERFVEALVSASLTRKVILVFDTLEEVILYQGTDMMKLLGQIKELHDSYPNLCLILSGRYDLASKLEGFAEKYGDESETLELQGFSDDDARQYLTEKRGITRLIDPIIRRANGNPFLLSLYAEVMRSNPRITAGTIERHPPGVLYLIKRIVRRIPNKQVRWLLRYGVVPRKLRLSFVEQVMAEYLPQAMAGKSEDDDPRKPSERVLAGENAFPKALRSPKSRVNLHALWQTLTAYASTNSWVTLDSEENTVSFHPEILKPMRRLLRDQKVFCKLHRKAIKYYEKAAKANSDTAGLWIQEAVYHKFQLEGTKAADYWRTQLTNPLVTVKTEWVLGLAREVVNFGADEDQASEQQNEVAIDKALRAEAYFEIAAANVEIARARNAGPQDPLWHDASRTLRASAELQRQVKRRIVPRARAAYVQAAILIAQKKLADAHAVLETALKLKASSADKINLEIEFANSLSRLGQQSGAVRHYRAAQKLARRAKLSPERMIEISIQLAAHYQHLGDLNKAIREDKIALSFAEKTRDQTIANKLVRRLAEAHLSAGQIEQAYTNLESPHRGASKISLEQFAQDEIEGLRREQLKGRLEIEKRDPLTALATLTRALDTAQSMRARRGNFPEIDGHEASIHEQIGLVHGELMEISSALNELEEARRLYKQAEDDGSVNRCLLELMNIQLRHGRNIKAARLLLGQVDVPSAAALSPAETQQEIQRIAILEQTDRLRGAQRALRRLAKISKERKWPAFDRAAIALTGVTHRARTGMSISLRESTASLRHVLPPSRRVTLLKEMSWCPTPRKVSGKLSTSFAKLLPGPAITNHCGAVNAITIADALRVVGKKAAPASLLQQAQDTFTDTNSLFALIEVYRAWDRLGWSSHDLSNLSENIAKFLEAYSRYPQLCLVVRLEQVGRLLGFKEFALAVEMLAEAEKLLSDKTTSPYWMGFFQELSGRLLIDQFWSGLARNAKPDKAGRLSLKDGLFLLMRAKSAYNHIENRLAVKRVDRYVKSHNKPLAVLTGKAAAKTAGVRKADNETSGRSTLLLKPKDKTVTNPAEAFAQSVQGDNGYSVRLSQAGSKNVTLETFFQGRPLDTKTTVKSAGLPELLPNSSGEMNVRHFIKLFSSNWLSVSHGMFSTLTTASAIKKKIFQSDRTSLINLALDIPDMFLAGLPWEFATLGPFKETELFSLAIDNFYRTSSDGSMISWAIRSLQSALKQLYPRMDTIDGFYGPETSSLVRMFQKENYLPVTGIADSETMRSIRAALQTMKRRQIDVLIVQPTSEQQLAADRGHGSGGVSLDFLYSSRGFRMNVLEHPTMSNLDKALGEGKPQLIHLCPLMKRSASIGIQLDFGGNYPIALSAIGKLLDHFSYSSKIRPLVILDVPRPPVFSETLTQLVLRNSFASELFRMGNTSAVIATGLAEQFDQQPTLTKILISSLAQGLSFGETVNKIREMSNEDLSIPRTQLNRLETLETIVGPFGTALFTQNPAAWLL